MGLMANGASEHLIGYVTIPSSTTAQVSGSQRAAVELTIDVTFACMVMKPLMRSLNVIKTLMPCVGSVCFRLTRRLHL